MPASTLRAWEQRYGFPAPERTASAYRLYSDADVARIARVRALCDAGLAAAEAVAQVTSEIGTDAGVPALGFVDVSASGVSGAAAGTRGDDASDPSHTSAAALADLDALEMRLRGAILAAPPSVVSEPPSSQAKPAPAPTNQSPSAATACGLAISERARTDAAVADVVENFMFRFLRGGKGAPPTGAPCAITKRAAAPRNRLPDGSCARTSVVLPPMRRPLPTRERAKKCTGHRKPQRRTDIRQML